MRHRLFFLRVRGRERELELENERDRDRLTDTEKQGMNKLYEASGLTLRVFFSPARERNRTRTCKRERPR